MKRVFFYILIIAFAVALGLSPAGKWVYSYFGESERNGTSQLSIKSIKGEYSVFIDNKSIGTVKDGESQIFAKIIPGMKEIKLVRKSSVSGFYFDFVRKIEFTPSAQIEIEWEAGPTLESSSGIVKYFAEIVKPEGADLLVESFPTNAKVELDGIGSETKVFDVKDGSVKKLKVSNGEGFETKEIEIALRDEKTGKVLTNLRLIVEVYLYKQPFI